MTVVIADTSPINYLVLISEIHVLPRLYGRVVVPEAVLSELTREGAPSEGQRWATDIPEWVEIRAAPACDTSLSFLDEGEAAAIALAESEPDVLLLIDDAASRLEASRRGIRSTGTLGVLRLGASGNLVDLPTALGRLSETNFRVSRALISELLSEDAERNPQA